MTLSRLVQTESTLTIADRLWRAEMRRAYGPDAVLVYGFGQAGRGEPGSRLRETFDARTAAVSAWRVARRRPYEVGL